MDDPGVRNFARSIAFVVKPFMPTGMKVDSPQLVTYLPTFKVASISAMSVVIYKSNISTFVSMSSSASFVKGAHVGFVKDVIGLYEPTNEAVKPTPLSNVPSISVNTFDVELKMSPFRKFILPSSALLEISSLLLPFGS